MRLSWPQLSHVRVHPYFVMNNIPSNFLLVYLLGMFPANAASIRVILVNMDDTKFRSRVIVAREDGQFGRPLFQGSDGYDSLKPRPTTFFS